MRLDHFFMRTTNYCRQINANTIKLEYYIGTGIFFSARNCSTSPKLGPTGLEAHANGRKRFETVSRMNGIQKRLAIA